MTSLLQNEPVLEVDETVISPDVTVPSADVDASVILKNVESQPVATTKESNEVQSINNESEASQNIITEISDDVDSNNLHTEIGAESHKKKGGLPQLDDSSYSSQLFWLAISFVLLYIMISKIILPRIHEILEKRRHRIEHDLDQADEMSSKADKAKSDYEALYSSAQAKTAQQTSDALDNVKKKHDLENAELDAILANKLAESASRIAASRDEMIDKLKPVAADISSEIVEKIIGSKADSKKLETILSGIKW